jgi:D-glycero-alpha-D-manno-heptose-7-phosphate kinase
MLFFTGISRFSSDILTSQISNIDNCYSQMNELKDMVDIGSSILRNINNPIEEFGDLLHQAWRVKRSLSKMVSNNTIDDIYEIARNNGAIGGKILGAGGGGFILFFVKPQDQEKVKDALNKLIHIPFLFENKGSKVVINQPNGF